MKVALYARVSSRRQEHEQTIESQLEALRARVREGAYELDEKHVFLDDGIPGARMDRPGLDRLRDAARDGGFKAVLVYDMDRLARRFVYQEVLREELQRLGIELISLKGRSGETPEDQMLIQMQGVFAEYERAKIVDRTRRGKMFRARQGQLLPWPCAPYGYRVTRSAAGGRHVEVDEEEAAWVRRIFSWLVDEGLTTRQITKRSTDQKVPTRKGRTIWHPCMVGHLLRNTIYVGRAYYNRSVAVEPKRPRDPARYRKRPKTAKVWRPPSEWIEFPVPALLDEDTFRRAAERLRANQQLISGPKPGYGQYLLRTLVRCGECGLKMTCYNAGGHRYYRCMGQDPYRTARIKRCPARLVRADRLDEAVWNRVAQLIENPDMLVKHVQGLHETYSTQERDELAQLQRLAELRSQADRQVQRLIDAYQAGLIEAPELAERRGKLDERIASLDRQQRESERRREEQIHEEKLAGSVHDLCDALRHGLERSLFEDRQRVLRLLIEEVSVKGSDVTMRHIIPVPDASVN